VKIGIGLPSTLLDVPGETMRAWGPRAEARGFSSLATIDRIAYPSYDSLTALAAAGAATERIGLFTNILIEPLYDPVLLAKVTASIDRIAGGRLTLGFAVGNRADDFELVGRSFADRGRRFDADLELLHRAWAGEPIPPSPFPLGPAPSRGHIPVMFGGQPDLAAPRAVRWNGGFTIGGAPPEAAAGAIQAFKAAWTKAGGQGEPRIVALSYFSLGEQHVEESLRNLRSYYGFLGDWAESIAMGTPRTPEAVGQRVAAWAELGIDELLMDPTVGDLDQIDLLADLVL
jgi:alkanesulfonate monooxygenase SsuD/methylene tetrahydromethanopterin reductase-like flavin-dependent oxidoreductase (luciferase family)